MKQTIIYYWVVGVLKVPDLVQDHGHVDHIAIRNKLLNPVANCKINFLLITIPASSQVYPMSKTTITLITLYSRKLTFLSALYLICYSAQNHNTAMCRFNTVSISSSVFTTMLRIWLPDYEQIVQVSSVSSLVSQLNVARVTEPPVGMIFVGKRPSQCHVYLPCLNVHLT